MITQAPMFPDVETEIPVSARSSTAGLCGVSGRKAVKRRVKSQADRVLAVIRRRASTDRQIAKATGLPLTTVLARRWALIKRGLVMKVPVGHVDTPQGTTNSLWGITEQGRKAGR